jgi:Tfp pilus assembly ATPase PilU
MQTFDQHLMDLVADGSVLYETALAAASKPADLELRLHTVRRRPRPVAPAGIAEKQPPS